MRASHSRRATDDASAAFIGGLAATFFPPGEPASPILLTHKLSPAPSLAGLLFGRADTETNGSARRFVSGPAQCQSPCHLPVTLVPPGGEPFEENEKRLTRCPIELIQDEQESSALRKDQTMKRKRHAEEQIIAILKEHEAGVNSRSVPQARDKRGELLQLEGQVRRARSLRGQASEGAGERERPAKEALGRRHARQRRTQGPAGKRRRPLPSERLSLTFVLRWT